MFDHNELEALAKQAKKKLRESTPSAEAPNDLYAEFREETEKDTTLARPTVQRAPQEPMVSPYTVDHTPTEEDWAGEEREEVDTVNPPIFPGGPRVSDVQVWKKEYSNYKIHAVQILDDFYVFRTLNRYEYKQIISFDVDQLQREEMICETCILFPSKYTWQQMLDDMAGVPSTLASIIMEKSGFTKEYAIQVL